LFVSRTNLVSLGLGANVAGSWGPPAQTLARAISELERLGLRILACSPVYASRPVGNIRQAWYLNAAVVASSPMPPSRLLRHLKALERAAGRRVGPRWGPRPLDIDLLTHGALRLNAKARHSRAARLVLPHPEVLRRGFVLVPLAAIAPRWRHPMLGLPASRLLARLGPRVRREVRALPSA